MARLAAELEAERRKYTDVLRDLALTRTAAAAAGGVSSTSAAPDPFVMEEMRLKSQMAALERQLGGHYSPPQHNEARIRQLMQELADERARCDTLAEAKTAAEKTAKDLWKKCTDMKEQRVVLERLSNALQQDMRLVEERLQKAGIRLDELLSDNYPDSGSATVRTSVAGPMRRIGTGDATVTAAASATKGRSVAVRGSGLRFVQQTQRPSADSELRSRVMLTKF